MTWKPGQSGNPAGTPGPKKIKRWREALDRAILRREQDDPQALEKLADRLLRAVEADDISAMKELGDRLDGKVTQPIGGDEEIGPVRLSWLK
jgi:hypothetical protein